MKDLMSIGHTYAVVSSCSHLVKIGRSKYPDERMKTIASYAGPLGDRFFSPKLKNCVIAELTLHKLFEKERVYGEWFRINLSDAIQAIKENISVDDLANEDYIFKAKDTYNKRLMDICKGIGLEKNNSINCEIENLSIEDQEELVLLTIKILNKTCPKALGHISNIEIVYDELVGGQIEAVWF